MLIKMYQMAAGPPATKPRKMNALFVVLFLNAKHPVRRTYLIVLTGFKATKLVPKFSI